MLRKLNFKTVTVVLFSVEFEVSNIQMLLKVFVFAVFPVAWMCCVLTLSSLENLTDSS